jgi:hypothetical protein
LTPGWWSPMAPMAAIGDGCIRRAAHGIARAVPVADSTFSITRPANG